MSPSQGQVGKCRSILRECESVRGMGNEQSYLGGGDSLCRTPSREESQDAGSGPSGWAGPAMAMTVYGEWEQTSYLERRLKRPSYSLCEAFEMIKLQNNVCSCALYALLPSHCYSPFQYLETDGAGGLFLFCFVLW